MGPLIPLISSLLPAVGQWFQGEAERDVARENTDKTIRANRELAEYSYGQDLSMWNRANEYNSPLAQMNRLKGSGLNPNLVYGTGAVGNSAGPQPRYNAPRVEYNYKAGRGGEALASLGSALGAYQDMELRGAQIDNVRAQTESTKVNTALQSGLAPSKIWEAKTRSSASLERFTQENILRRYNAEIAGWEADNRSGVLERKLRGMDLSNEQREQEIIYSRFRNEWMKQGVTTSDHPLIRMAIRMGKAAGVDPSDYVRDFFQQFKP